MCVIFVSEMNFALEMKIHNELEMNTGNEIISSICCGNELRNEHHTSQPFGNENMVEMNPNTSHQFDWK